jgi:hypothetical protein
VEATGLGRKDKGWRDSSRMTWRGVDRWGDCEGEWDFYPDSLSPSSSSPQMRRQEATTFRWPHLHCLPVAFPSPPWYPCILFSVALLIKISYYPPQMQTPNGQGLLIFLISSPLATPRLLLSYTGLIFSSFDSCQGPFYIFLFLDHAIPLSPCSSLQTQIIL